MSCGCGSAGCSCNITGGDGVTVTGTGTKSNPFTISAEGGSTVVDTADTPSMTWTESGDGTIEDPIVLSAAATSPITAPMAQVFTVNGTWTKPAGVGTVRVYIAGGGGGGAGGGMQASPVASTFRSAGGGNGGSYMWRDFAAADVPASVAVTVGAGGTGGAGATTAPNSGANGTAGAASSFGTLITAAGGAAGITNLDPLAIAPGANGPGSPGLTPGGGGYGGYLMYGTPTTTRRTNLVTNPSFETNSTGYVGSTNTTLSRLSTGTKPTGGRTWVLRLTGQGLGPSMGVAQTALMPVTPGKSYTYQASFLRNSHVNWTGIKGVYPLVYWYAASGGSSIGSTALPSTSLADQTVWYRNWGAVTAPEGANFASITWTIYVGGIATSAVTVDMDAVLFTLGNTLVTYFDGATASTTTTGYAWSGTADASTSIATLIGGNITFYPGGSGGGVPAVGLSGGSGGPGGGTAASVTAAGLGGGGSSGEQITTVSNRPGGAGGGGGGSGRTVGAGGFGSAGSGGGGGATGLTPTTGNRGGDGGKGFVSVIAW